MENIILDFQKAYRNKEINGIKEYLSYCNEDQHIEFFLSLIQMTECGLIKNQEFKDIKDILFELLELIKDERFKKLALVKMDLLKNIENGEIEMFSPNIINYSDILPLIKNKIKTSLNKILKFKS